MSALLELAARVEAASGGNRELDCRAWCAKQGADFELYCSVVPDLSQWQAPYYTSSLNAAMTLMVDSDYYAMFGLERDLRDGTKWTARFDTHGDECGHGDSIICTAATAPLALTAACLRLRATEHPQ